MVPNADPTLINADLAPTTAEQRHWTVVNMASLWVGMVVCVPTYMLAAGLIDQGMSWWQAVATVMFGNVIVLVPMVLNGIPGTAYGVPFPVLARAAFGTRGAHVPSLLRALVGCGWFGIQTWLGGQSIYQLGNIAVGGALSTPPLPWLDINPAQLACFLLFWVIQVVIIHKGLETIRVFETLAAPFLIVAGLALLGWAWWSAGGFGPMMERPSAFDPGGPKEGQFWAMFFPSLTAMVGFWATLSLNIPDFTRYARSQRDQLLGQAIGLPTTMTLFAFIGVAVTSTTPTLFGETIWDPNVLLGRMAEGGGGAGLLTVAVSLFALSIATLSTNIAANVVSPANALINADPARFDFRTGGFITAAIGLCMFPWKILSSTGGYIFTWLIGYSALLGPIGGILIADYFLWRRGVLDVPDLYRHDGRYGYRGGYNPIALGALALAVAPNVPGFLHAAGAITTPLGVWDTVYTYAWFVGFGLAGALYLLGMWATGQERPR
jgi:NCS1 family nucleobase:cation symporter-1